MFFKYIENMQIEFDYNQDLYTTVPDIDTPEIVQKVEDMMDDVVSDVVNNAITDVFETDVLSAETAMILNACIRYLLVEYLETNFEAIDTRLAPPSNMQRNFVRIHDQCIQFLCSELASSSEGEEDDSTENYVTPYGDQIYWSAIDNHPLAYKYFTITDPLSVHKVNIPKGSTKEQIEKLQNELREKYRVKIRKADKIYGRLSIEFDEGHEFKIPKMIWGTGDESGNGKGFIYKEGDGMYLTYTTRVDVDEVITGTEIGLKITDEGSWFYDIKSGEWKLIGSGGGDGNFIILDHVPTQEEIDSYEDNTLIFVYDVSDPGGKFGRSAYQTALDEGWTGSTQVFNDSLASVGNIPVVLDTILGEELNS